MEGLIADAKGGGAGNSVSISSSGNITTRDKASYGIFAQSDGVNGGTGGNGSIWHSAGKGGDGRRGGNVTVGTQGGTTITTYGNKSSGIVAVSRAGNAGNGGDGGDGGVRWGGPGGTGGNGGNVRVTGSGTIMTGMTLGSDGILTPNGAGKYASGILTLSEGGDGGNGGEGHAGMGAGNGGRGGLGGTVEVIGDWNILTGGEKAHGIWGRSTGGYGGSGGSAGKLRGGGGSGGAALEGGIVTIESGGDIETRGADSYGIYAQSVGGFGGNGGGGFGLFCSIGAPGNNAGDGGVVSVTNKVSGSITTNNDRAHGIYAQSIGGGGGSGGGAGSIVAVGGKGAAGGNGGTVFVTNDGDISTIGGNARGIYAQSIGGGGGDGGNSGGFAAIGGEGSTTSDGGNVTVTNNGIVTTKGFRSYAIFAESVGGGGGDGGDSGGIFTIGGKGGGGGDADTVRVVNNGTLATDGPEATALFAQSVGGGGGNGGGAVSVSEKVSIAIGGKGGAGGDGKTVRVDATTDSKIITKGVGAYGILAQSIGGGGGNGGFSVAGNIGGALSLTLAIGGDGGTGGNGGDVDMDNAGNIFTSGKDAHGIFAQSVGGGGGNGGMSIAGGVGGGTSLKFSFGGKGGIGGQGGKVYVGSEETPITGAIETSGDRSHGIFAQSVGGGGGNGGNAITGQLLGGQTLSFSFGGDGGAGSFGEEVKVYNAGNITTGYDVDSEMVTGSESHGILAQSIGGGGGNGGMSLSAGVTAFGGLTFSMGGKGGDGSHGGKVTVDNRGIIGTWGDYSHGILSQSVGGGGGNGGTAGSAMINFASLIPLPKPIPGKLSANFSVAMGGEGGKGGIGGTVDVKNEGIIVTDGDNSYGIMAQSVGGGGGAGGKSIAATGNISLPDDPPEVKKANKQLEVKIDFALALGGAGGDGNNGGTVTVENQGAIETSGDGSHGIVAQSIGGGGGMGGDARSMTLSIDPSNSSLFPSPPEDPFGSFSKAVNISVGGSAGGGSNAGAVTVTNRAEIVTLGADSYGIMAQSIGGGGGSGGGGYHGLDWTDLGVPEDYADLWEEVSPIESGSDLQIVVGGSGGSSGDGGKVTVDNDGRIKTSGGGSFAIFAQSIGAGGGNGGVGAVGEEGTVGIGGGGGASGDGGLVKINQNGDICTKGAGASGIFAQSIGGGGGIAGNVDRGVENFGISLDFNLDFGQDGGSAGNGGSVDIISSGTIWTRGSGSCGIFSQSVGGGGGLAGDVVSVFSGSVGGDGSGGEVTVKHTGDIKTAGDASHGIFVQSAGGRSGSVTQKTTSLEGKFFRLAKDNLGEIIFGKRELDNKDDLGGNVTVTIEGNILTYGADSHGILAQSLGGDGNGDILINVNSGLVQGGNGTGTGVYFMDGKLNTLINKGAITTLAGLEGMAVRGTGGSETINNDGTITGLVDLGSGTNAFKNNAGGLLNSGVMVNLGSGGTFTNMGFFAPGGHSTFGTTTLTGVFEQDASGSLDMEIDRFGNHDKLVVASGSALLGGALNITKGGGPYLDGTTYDLLETTDDTIGGTFSSMSLAEPKPLLSFLLNQSANKVELEVDARKFTTVATNPAEYAVADYLDRIMPTVTGDLADVLGEIQELSLSQFDRAFSSLTPATYDGLTKSALAGIQQCQNSFGQRLNNVRAGSFAGAYVSETKPILLAYNGPMANLGGFPPREREARAETRNDIWVGSYSQWGDQSGRNGIPGYDYNIFGGTSGYDYTFVSPDRAAIGLSIAYSNTDIEFGEDLGSGSSNGYIGSVYGSYFPGNAYVEGAISYGNMSIHNNRRLNIGTIFREASSKHDANVYAIYLGGGYDCNINGVKVSPFGALRYVHIEEESFTETGADDLNLVVAGRGTDSFKSELGVRAGYQFNFSHASLIPEMSASFNYDYDIGDHIITSSFAGSPGAAFSIKGQENDRCSAAVTASLTYVLDSGLSTSLIYTGMFGESNSSHGIMGGFRYKF